MLTISKFLRSVLPFLLVVTVISIALPSTASADQEFPCGGVGRTYWITTAGEVKMGGSCTGDITIPASATSIGNGAFQSASGLTSVTFTSSIQSIGTGAFMGTTLLNTITIPSSVQSFGSSAFRNSGITTFTIPSGVNSIGALAFLGMSSLTSFTVDPANTSFSSLGGVLFNKLQTQLIQYPKAKTGTSYEVPSSVTSISSYSFSDLAYLTSITIPSGVTSFGSNVFPPSMPPFMISPITSYTYCGSASLVGTNISGTKTSCSSASGAPTIGTATATGTTTATVSFTAPASDGGATISKYIATSNPGSITAEVIQATSGTISVTGLSPSTSYTFTITALNSVGASSASAASNSITTSATPAPSPTPSATPSPTPSPTRDSGPPPSFLIVKTTPTISLTADVYTCHAGTLIFLRYGRTEEPSKISYQVISLLKNGEVVASSLTLKSQATFEKSPTWTGSTMTCQIYVTQENTVATFSSLGADKYNELSKAKGATIRASEAKFFADLRAAHAISRVEFSRISNERASDLKVASGYSQVKAAAAKYRLARTRTSETWRAEIQAAPVRRDASIAAAAATFIQGLEKYGLSIIQP